MAGYIKNSDGGYSVNYEDERFKSVENEQAQKEQELSTTYNDMINNSDKYYEDQIKATQEYAEKQSELQQANTDFAIQQIEQQKEQTQKDYTKEQKGAYADYMKQTKSNAQNMANSGLQNSGYSESSVVSIYNTYQNRVATAKDSLNRSILNYNNSITQAQLSNNERLAEIAFNALQTQNQLSQQAFEYKNTLILQKENALQQINDIYYARYQNVLAQINNEIELQMELDRIDREYEQWLKEYRLRQEQMEIDRQFRREQLDLARREADRADREVAARIQTERAQAAMYQSSTYGNSSNNNSKSSGSTQSYNSVASSIRELKQIKANPTSDKSRANAIQALEKWKTTIAQMGEQGVLSQSQQEQLYSMIANG